jgi:hypothetical protein
MTQWQTLLISEMNFRVLENIDFFSNCIVIKWSGKPSYTPVGIASESFMSVGMLH